MQPLQVPRPAEAARYAPHDLAPRALRRRAPPARAPARAAAVPPHVSPAGLVQACSTRNKPPPAQVLRVKAGEQFSGEGLSGKASLFIVRQGLIRLMTPQGDTCRQVERSCAAGGRIARAGLFSRAWPRLLFGALLFAVC